MLKLFLPPGRSNDSILVFFSYQIVMIIVRFSTNILPYLAMIPDRAMVTMEYE